VQLARLQAQERDREGGRERERERVGAGAGKKRTREERAAQRLQRAALQKAQRSQFVKDLQAEVLDAPEEDAAVGSFAARGADTVSLLKQQQRLEARAAVEEDMMVCSSLIALVPRPPCMHAPGQRRFFSLFLK
jgi:hypothetical protein